MIKHIGKHNGKKVVILYRKVPGEDHMCLVVYSDSLTTGLHEAIMSAVESSAGQEAVEFADALFRVKSSDGSNVLESCHRNGCIKKIQTSQVLVTPTTTATIRLDELNSMLDQMAQGDAAVKKMAELDSNLGLSKTTRANESKTTSGSVTGEPALTTALTDADIAKQQIVQAERLKREATGLLAEATRLEAEAKTLDPTITNGSQEPTTA